MSDTRDSAVVSPTDSAALKQAQEQALSENIKILENFYTFLIGLAMTQATFQLITRLEESENIFIGNIGYFALYFSFLVTIVPFYQGMNRFLYETHVVRPLRKPKSTRTPLLLDIYAFILMSGLIFALARSLDNPENFFYIWSTLLLVDITWQLTVWRIQASRQPIWAYNNIAWLAIAWLYWLLINIPEDCNPLPSIDSGFWLYGFVLTEIGRTVTDYSNNWKFYFPSAHRTQPL